VRGFQEFQVDLAKRSSGRERVKAANRLCFWNTYMVHGFM